jgi:DNA-binding MarR family transcriptional regulator/GNAT superfamily N-acetyltransferase
MPSATPGAIGAIRKFNRFYTRQLGLLERGLLGSDFSLTEARVMYELAHRSEPLASELARDLDLDFGYLSRLLKRFEHAGFLRRLRSRSDARQSTLQLTRTGRSAFLGLDRAARRQVAALLRPLNSAERGELLSSMQTVERLLEARGPARDFSVRGLKAGDVGWIVHRQGLLYASEYGWDQSYEALVAEILASFVKNFDPERENAWVAERGGQILGSVFLVRASESVAKLRLLYVEPAARGLGIGAHLVKLCIHYARSQGYQTLTLWTNDVLVAARRIYQAEGFRLVKEEPHHAFGKDLVGQNWDLDLMAPPATP